jgi:hypothetical protein
MINRIRCGWWVISLVCWIAGNDPTLGQVLFSEDFSNPTTAATRFSINGNVSYAGGVITALPGSSATLVPGLFFDSGLTPITYRVTQSFAPGSIVHPQAASAQLRLRGTGSSSEQGYYVTTLLNNQNAFIGIGRLTDAERANGIQFTSILGGTDYATPALHTLGPYDINVLITNTATAVTISVYINGVFSLTAVDQSPYRITQGDLLELECRGTHATSWDNLTVSVVPEPSTGALVLSAAAFQMVFRRRTINLQI